jgi:NAD(P)-dependent dehydrogenase (short-subunit alcohol dehydrogenase family)
MGLLEGRYAVVTGAASERGLGRAMAKLFAEHGAIVAVLDLDEAAAKAVAAEIGPDHVGLACNVADKAACEAAVAELERRWARIDVLVNNAGISQPLKIMEIAPENYNAVMDVNLRGTLNMCQAVIPGMRARRSGSIVNLSSVSAQRGGGIFGGPHYSAAKAGILGLTKAMARELGPDQVRVNAICPSLISTDITAGMSDATRARVIEGIPMGRAGEASDVAGCALFLASDLSGYCTGIELDVNGGSHIH